eukprot:229366_1
MSQIGTNITTAILVYTIAISLVNCCDSKVRNFVLCLVWIIIWCIILFIGHMFDPIFTECVRHGMERVALIDELHHKSLIQDYLGFIHFYVPEHECLDAIWYLALIALVMIVLFWSMVWFKVYQMLDE